MVSRVKSSLWFNSDQNNGIFVYLRTNFLLNITENNGKIVDSKLFLILFNFHYILGGLKPLCICCRCPEFDLSNVDN